MDEFFLDSERPTLHDRRELGKLALDTFPLYFDNKLDDTADATIADLLKQNDQSTSNARELENLKKTDPARWEELQERVTHSEIDLEMQIHEHLSDDFHRYGVLVAYAEMKIMYAFKQLEITINQLLKSSYPLEMKKGLNRFDDLRVFCQSKNIDVTKVDGFTEIEELRKLANVLKHSGNMESWIGLIPEFKGKEDLYFEDLQAFYTRVRTAPMNFIKGLSGKIHDDLYDFSEERLGQLAENLVLQMDKSTAFNLIQKIGVYYT